MATAHRTRKSFAHQSQIFAGPHPVGPAPFFDDAPISADDRRAAESWPSWTDDDRWELGPEPSCFCQEPDCRLCADREAATMWDALVPILEPPADVEPTPPVDETDRAWLAGRTLGYEMVPNANPPRVYSDVEVVAWFSGYHAGHAKAIADILDDIAHQAARDAMLLDEDPADWTDPEAMQARSNGGHSSEG